KAFRLAVGPERNRLLREQHSWQQKWAFGTGLPTALTNTLMRREQIRAPQRTPPRISAVHPEFGTPAPQVYPVPHSTGRGPNSPHFLTELTMKVLPMIVLVMMSTVAIAEDPNYGQEVTSHRTGDSYSFKKNSCNLLDTAGHVSLIGPYITCVQRHTIKATDQTEIYYISTNLPACEAGYGSIHAF